MNKSYLITLLLTVFTTLFLMTGVTFAQDPSPDDWSNSGTDSVKTDKNVGIGLGTATPSHKLDIFTGVETNVKTYNYGLETTVNTNGGWARALRFRNENNNAVAAFGSLHGEAYIATGFDINTDPTGYLTPKLFIKSNGNVSIGTTSPAPTNKFQVHQTGTTDGSTAIVSIANGATTGSNYGLYSIASGASVNNWGLYVYQGDAYIQGKVGIGTSTPRQKLDIQGQIAGGFGSMTTAGNLDWNDSSNARSGSGYTLLLGDATNGPGPHAYYHPFSFEYISKDGSGNMLQMAMPYYLNYTNGGDNIWMRSRYEGTWSGWRKILSEDSNGNVGIGTSNPTNKLDVNGTIRAKEVKVETNWSDFVFEDNYTLPTLDNVESFIKENKHLPDIPSAKEVEEEGLSMSQMMAKQMQKIEELTLYVIEQNKQLTNQNKKLESVIKENEQLKSRVTELETRY
jgi:hypothetical protein